MNKKHNATGRSSGEQRHVRLYHWLLQSAAWQGLGPVDRALYIELSSRFFGSNNGQIILSVRQASDALHVSKATAARAFEALQRHGFVAVQHHGGFNLKNRKGQATEWRLTEHPHGTAAVGTKEFMRWTTGNDFPVSRIIMPARKTKASKGGAERPSPLVNYMRPSGETVNGEKTGSRSHQRDPNVTFLPPRSHQRDRTVSPEGHPVSPEGPCSELPSEKVGGAA